MSDEPSPPTDPRIRREAEKAIKRPDTPEDERAAIWLLYPDWRWDVRMLPPSRS